jgi:phage tail-like protein
MGTQEPPKTRASARDEAASPRATRESSRAEPLTGASFRVEIDGLPDVAAVEVVFPEGRIVTERGKRLVRYGSLTLRRALTGSQHWYRWWDSARRPDARTADVSRTVRVILIDRFDADVNHWTFSTAEPTAYSMSPLNALLSAPLVETLELSVGGFEAAFDLSSRNP